MERPLEVCHVYRWWSSPDHPRRHPAHRPALMSHTAERPSELPPPARQEGRDEGKDRVPEARSFRVPGAEGPARRLPIGHLRGLALGLALSLLNLAGAFL